MENERMMELLRAAVDHIESFEEDEASNVLSSLGFTEDELAEIKASAIVSENPWEDLIASDEMINFWFDELLIKKGKTFTNQLTAEEIQEEIEEVEGTISNEKLWALTDDMHYQNIADLTAYLERLNELLTDDEQKNAPVSKQEWRIVIVSDGGTKHHFMGGYKSEEEANAAAASYDWRFVDENRFEWRLEVEEDEPTRKEN